MFDNLFAALSQIRTPADLAHHIAAYKARTRVAPNDFVAHLELGVLLRYANDIDGAAEAFDRAAFLNPGHAAPFTLRSTMLFRQHFGAPKEATPVPVNAETVSMSTLGFNGRFGNQLLQYGFLRAYAKRFGVAVETADWIGRDLFELDDPLPHASFPIAEEQRHDLVGSIDRPDGAAYKNHDFIGYFAGSPARWARAAEFRALYKPSRCLTAILARALDTLQSAGATLVAIHIRHGDFATGANWIAPAEWYLAWLEQMWPTLNRPVLYVASDNPEIVREFGGFAPLTLPDLKVTIPGAEFYLDHFVLSQAHHLAISNSSFSFTAAMLNERAISLVRPDPNKQVLLSFDPWSAEVFLPPARALTR